MRTLIRKRGVAWMAASVVMFAMCGLAYHAMKADPLGGDFDRTVAGIPLKLLPILVGAALCGLLGISVFIAEWRKTGKP
jgi:hypothetical protein